MTDILYQTEDFIFSYRVAGICIQNGCVLLQKPQKDNGYAFPGGHVSFGETNTETLMREFREEMGADISVGELKWVAENFFPWGEMPCHQIALYYIVTINNPNIPMRGSFLTHERAEGDDSAIRFHWVSLDELSKIKIYPENTAELLTLLDKGVQHFIYREN